MGRHQVSQELPHVDAGGERRPLGNLMPMHAPSPNWRVFGTTPDTPLMTRDELIALIPDDAGPEDPFLTPITDQDGIGQCNANDTITCIEYARSWANLPYVELSPADLYHRINGGSDRGSMLEDAMREALERGVGTAATCGVLWKKGYFKGEASAAERQLYRVFEAYLCPTFLHCISAVSLPGFSLSSGVMWYDNYEPDSKGWLPSKGQGGGGGHAVMGYKPTRRGKTLGIWHQNSWGGQWGLNGRCVFPESAYGGPVGGWWAVRAVTDSGGHDVPDPT